MVNECELDYEAEKESIAAELELVKQRKEAIEQELGSSIKDAARNYGQAAVFIGTACLYMGTPQECDDVCDDLWHHGQQAHVEMLTGEETSFNVL